MSDRLYKKIANQILRDILDSELKPGSKLQSVREYALKYKVNPKTIQRAFDYLEQYEVFVIISGDGRYLSSNYKCIDTIRFQLIDQEVELFVEKMKLNKLSYTEITELIKEKYE